MPIYPVIPITQFYNNAVTYDPRAAKVELGKGGVLDRSSIHFFNNTRKSYSISAVLKDRDTLQNFLELNRGKPFEFRYDGSNSAGLYICKTWSWDWVVYVDGVSGVWNFSATFEQVFRPGWVSQSDGLGTLIFSSITLSGIGSIIANPPFVGGQAGVRYNVFARRIRSTGPFNRPPPGPGCADDGVILVAPNLLGPINAIRIVETTTDNFGFVTNRWSISHGNGQEYNIGGLVNGCPNAGFFNFSVERVDG